MIKFEWFLAKRYFGGQRKESRFLSFIKIMAITGVAVGAAGLLIALSIVHGFKSVIHEKVTGFAPHVTVTPFSDEYLFRADTLVTYISRFEGVQAAQPVVNSQVMVQSRSDISGALLKGVPPQGDITDLQQYITAGEYNLGISDEGLPGILLGERLARTIGAEIGGRVTGYRVEGVPSPFNPPELQQFILTGTYRTGIERLDDGFGFVDIQYARTLAGIGRLQATGLDIRTHTVSQIEPVYEEIILTLPHTYSVESIYQRYRNIFAWVDLQEQTIPFVISMMVIIAAFNLIGTILMMVLERVRDIGILKTMGAKESSILRIFMLEGFFVAGAGLSIGIGIALLFNWLQSTWQIIPLSEENYYMSYAPVEPHALDYVIVIIVTLLLCAIASWLPARVAANTNPVKVLVFGN
ncbi:MAG: ABC transporter permease [Balneolaceae bacterium]